MISGYTVSPMSNYARQSRGPFEVASLRENDRYELVDGHAMYCSPAGTRHASANLLGAAVIETDPKVANAGVDAGVRLDKQTLLAPDVSVGNINASQSGFTTQIPSLAVEYADSGQDENALDEKIKRLLEAGTKLIWVVRLAKREVEVHRKNKAMERYYEYEALPDDGLLQNMVDVRMLLDRDEAHEGMLRNLLSRYGYKSLDEVKGEGVSEGKAEGFRDGEAKGLREGKMEGFRDGEAKGLREGKAEGLRRAIYSLCDVLPVALNDERKAQIEAMSAEQLDVLRASLVKHRVWPKDF